MYFSGSWTTQFLVATFLCAAVGGLPTANPNVNITISVPEGTSDHGDPNLLCTPTKWLHVLVFFFANYLAHAATVKALPGESTIDLAFAVFLAIVFPFSGVARGLEAIVRHASFSWHNKSFFCDDLQTAARAGALCIVVRNEDWDGLSLNSSTVIKPARGDIPSAAIHESKYELEYVTPTYRKVHGLSELPKGYSLALLPSNAHVVPNKPYQTGHQKSLTLSSSASIPQSMVAIFQVLYASYTLYKTRGDQLDRYGYAAFGLTVIPYIIMSFLNLLGNLSTPNYPTLYLVGSAELEEAKLQKDAAIDGVVGSVAPVTCCEEYKDHFTGRVRWSLSHGNQDRQVFLTECSPFKIARGKPYRGPKPLRLSSFLWWGFMVLLGAIPYGVIGGLTQFQAAQSTQSQRVLTMFWLASGVFIGATIPFISFSFHEILDIIKGSFSQKARETADEARKKHEEAKKNFEEASGKAEEAREEAEEARNKARGATEAAKGAKMKLEEAQRKVSSLRAAANANDESRRRCVLPDFVVDAVDGDEPPQGPWCNIEVRRPIRSQNTLYSRWRDDHKEADAEQEVEREKAEDYQKRSAEEKATEDLQKATANAEARAKEESEANRKAAARAEDQAKAEEDKAKAEEDRAKAGVVFLGSLGFCAGAIGGFVVVGQMLTDYGSCVLLS